MTTQFPDMEDKIVRHDFVTEKVVTGIGMQIKAMREARGWSEAEMGKKMNRSEFLVARLESKEYGKYGLALLLEIADLFDVWLKVEFMSYRAGQTHAEETSKTALSWERERRAEAKVAEVKPVVEVDHAYDEHLGPILEPVTVSNPTKPAAKPVSEPWVSRAMGPGKATPKK